MRMLILSANTGGGHNATALALSAQMKRLGIDCEIEDALSFISPRTSEMISRGHSYVYRRLPKLFGVGYRYEERHSVDFIYRRCAKGVEALGERLACEPVDAVICTHVFSGLMMTELRRRHGVKIPCYFIATDYTCSPGVSQIDAEGYFIPHPRLSDEFVGCGIAAEKLFATGIPVGDAFYQRGDPRELKCRLGLPQDKRVILLGCGSMGGGGLERVARTFLRGLPENICLVVLCGTNQRAYELLRQYESDCFLPLPFIHNVWEYMGVAELYLTKPGGLTTSEAIAGGTPMILVDAVPGCETRNYHFLTACGVACGAKGWRHANALVQAMLPESESLGALRKAMEQFGTERSAERVCRILLEQIS